MPHLIASGHRCAVALLLMGCTPGTDRVRQSPESDADTDADTDTDTDTDTDGDTDLEGCPADMVQVDDVCMDRYEAPNEAGELPLVMYHYYEAGDWCEARGKRLCYDDEWQRACEGPTGTAYPYGNTHQPGVCNDEEIWRTYDQSLLSAWPGSSLATDDYERLDELLSAARALSPASADHVEWLYQGEGGGDNPGCGGHYGVFDLTGNVEEWTIRRDGGDGPDFSGNLKGRYWSESRTCQSGVKSHGNAFRFYEIGFRCCRDLPAR